jgi:hypothetical protein
MNQWTQLILTRRVLISTSRLPAMARSARSHVRISVSLRHRQINVFPSEFSALTIYRPKHSPLQHGSKLRQQTKLRRPGKALQRMGAAHHHRQVAQLSRCPIRVSSQRYGHITPDGGYRPSIHLLRMLRRSSHCFMTSFATRRLCARRSSYEAACRAATASLCAVYCSRSVAVACE